MRNILLLITSILLYSCSINTNITYHKDSTQTILMNVDMKDFFAELKNADSTNIPKFRFPKQWTSLYDMDVKDGKKMPRHTDSTRMMRKISIKENPFNGFSIKMDKINDKDLKFINKNMTQHQEKIYLDEWIWNGETLIIPTKNWDFSKTQNELTALLKMNFHLHFEEKIKSIKGKHRWIRKIDSNNVEINLNFKNKKKPNNQDSEIIITIDTKK